MTDAIDRRTFLQAAGAAGITLVLAGCSSGGDGGSEPTATPTSEPDGEERVETDHVDMTDELTFEPEHVQVAAGTTVTWETVGTVGHTVTAYEDKIPEDAEYFASGGFESEDAATEGYPEEGNVAEGETYEHTFETTGLYEYYCIPHEMNGMVGTVKVV